MRYLSLQWVSEMIPVGRGHMMSYKVLMYVASLLPAQCRPILPNVHGDFCLTVYNGKIHFLQ